MSPKDEKAIREFVDLYNVKRIPHGGIEITAKYPGNVHELEARAQQFILLCYQNVVPLMDTLKEAK